jgi:hypothetical protein
VSLRFVAFGLVASLFVVSLAYSVVRTAQNQPFTYFDTFARVWEFALGSLVAIALPWIRLAPSTRFIAGWVGLIGVLACGIVLPVSRVFPGYAALWPTAAAMLILLGHDSGSRFGADRLLSFRPLTFLGDRSYGIYLWHWPMFVFYRLVTDRASVSIVEGLGIIGCAVVVASIAAATIENPIRRDRREGVLMHPVRVAAYAALPLVVVVGLWSGYAYHMKHMDGRVLSIDDPKYPGAAALEAGPAHREAPPAPVHPGPMAVKSDRPSMLQHDCFQDLHSSEPLSCAYGDPSSTRVIAAVGASHVAHWVPALDWFASREGWKLVTFTKNRCALTTDRRYVSGEEYTSCAAWNENVIHELLRSRPTVVFVRATTGVGSSEKVPAGFIEQWRRLTESGITVIAIRDTPRFPFDVPDCVARYGPVSMHCEQPSEQALAPVNPALSWEGKLAGVYFIDLTRYFCSDGLCHAVVGNVLVYSDDSHITTHYVRTLAPMLKRELSRITAQLAASVQDGGAN